METMWLIRRGASDDPLDVYVNGRCEKCGWEGVIQLPRPSAMLPQRGWGWEVNRDLRYLCENGHKAVVAGTRFSP